MSVHADPAAGATRPRPPRAAALWRPADLRTGDWCVELDAGQRAALAAAARRAVADGLTPVTVTRDTFPLPELAGDVAGWLDALGSGRGFVLLRGFPVDELTEAETEVAYVGLGTHLGTPVGQNAAGERLTHIRDERLGETGPHVRRYRTNERQDFHTDGADVIGLLCLHGARSGGQSRIVSSYTVYEEIRRRRPDLFAVLHQPLAFDRQGGDDAVGTRWFPLAPFAEGDGGPRVFYIGWYVRDAQRHPDAPRLTAEQIEAMELLESIANDPAFHVEMDFRPGDVQLLNNACILHAREAFEDDEDPASRRHLLRLWLAADLAAGVEDGLRGGISAPAGPRA